MNYPEGVSVCLPTWRRAEHLLRRIEMLRAALPDVPNFEVILACDEDDSATLDLQLPLGVRRLVFPPGKYPTTGWNVTAVQARFAWLLMATDDVEWSRGWWPGYSRLPARGYLGLHDQLSRRCGSHTLWLARRDWLMKYAGGTLVCPLVRHIFADVIMTLLAVRSGTSVVASGLIGEHVHSFTDQREDVAIDESRRRAHQWRDDGRDHLVYEDLKQRGFPVGLAASSDWRPLW